MSKNSKAPNDNHIPFASRLEISLCIVFGCLNIALSAMVIHFFDSISPVIFAVAFTAIYLIEIALINFKRKTKAKVLPHKSIHDLLSEESSIVFRNMLSPLVALDSNGTILWHNDSMKGVFNSTDNVIGENIEYFLEQGTVNQLFK